jgi:hypothetical protein
VVAINVHGLRRGAGVRAATRTEYRYAIGEGAIEKQFEYPHSPRILSVFEDDKALELTQRHLSQRADFGADFAPFFFFNTLAGVMADWRKRRPAMPSISAAHGIWRRARLPRGNGCCSTRCPVG